MHIYKLNENPYPYFRKMLFAFLFLFISVCSSAQNPELEKKMARYFEDIPVLKPVGAILTFLYSDTVKYKTYLSRDYVTDSVKEFDVYRYYYQKDTFYTQVYFRSEYPLDLKDTAEIYTSIIGTRMSTNTTLGAKRGYKKLKHEFSSCFPKSRNERGFNPLMGGRWKTTYFYLNKNDKFPFMEISWESAADMMGNGYSIDIYKPNF